MDTNPLPKLSVSLPEADAGELLALLNAQSTEYAVGTTFKHEGGGAFVTIILPCVLTAVQVIATFLAAKLSSQNTQATDQSEAQEKEASPQLDIDSIRIKIDKVHVNVTEFSQNELERILGRSLEDD